MRLTHDLSVVMPGLVPGTHAFVQQSKAWVAGTSPAMTNWRFHVIETCASRDGLAQILMSSSVFIISDST
jgi:hypothetical protein